MKYQPHQQPPEPSAPAFDGTQACAGVELNVFFPPNGGRAATDRAKDICSSCHWIAPCLEYAMEPHGSPARYVAGVWAHTTAGERAAIRRRRLSPDTFQAAA